MYYFKFIAFILGACMISMAPAMVLQHEEWKDFILKRIYPEKRPLWMQIAAAIFLVIIVLTWFKEAVTQIPGSWVITLLLTLGLPKCYFLQFKYDDLRSFAIKMVERKWLMRYGLPIIAYALGLLLLALAVFVY